MLTRIHCFVQECHQNEKNLCHRNKLNNMEMENSIPVSLGANVIFYVKYIIYMLGWLKLGGERQ